VSGCDGKISEKFYGIIQISTSAVTRLDNSDPTPVRDFSSTPSDKKNDKKGS
jgi:hypothetical protein